jgi:hypothetical protein
MFKKKYICRNCGELTNKSYKRSSFVGSLAWLVFIFLSMGLGIIVYAIAKSGGGSQNCCPHCRSDNSLVPTNSPMGRELLKRIV